VQGCRRKWQQLLRTTQPNLSAAALLEEEAVMMGLGEYWDGWLLLR
jgi:hypothetical protein